MTSLEAEGGRLRTERLRKLEELKARGVKPYPYRFERTDKAISLQEKYKDLANDTETQDVVMVCGKVLNERNSWMFVDLYDETGKIQLFCHKESLSQEKLDMRKLLDKGDYLGVTGTIRRTKAGELSIRVTDYEVLCKSLQPFTG